MWILRTIIVMTAIGSIAQAQNFYDCYEYRANNFSLNSPVSWQRIIIAVPKVFPQEESYPSVLLFLDKSGRKMSMQQQIYCHWKNKKNHYECGGEGDMGYLLMDKDMALSFDAKEKLGVNIEVANQAQQEVAVMDLKQGIAQAQANKTPCPPYVEQIFNPLRDGEHAQNGPLLNVCYTSKEHSGTALHYKGCTMQVKPCQTLGKKHFGHYQSSSEAYQAFLRCIDGRPLK